MRKHALLGIVFAFAASGTALAYSEKVVDVTSRPGITQRFLFASPEKPRAVVLLYAGGNGQLGITDAGRITGLGGNFLVRSRRMFVAAGYTVAVLDMPSDSSDNYRTTEASAADTKAVIDRVRIPGVPVILVGTSRGSISAANAAARLGPAVDGLVLTSSVTESYRGQDSVNSLNLTRIAIPVLVMSNREDRCIVSPPSGSEALSKRFTAKGSTYVEVTSSDGAGDPCEGASAHGYAKHEQEAVDAIAKWIDISLAKLNSVSLTLFL